MSVRDLLIVGAGPTGLSAGIAAKRVGFDYQILEQGVLVNSIYRFPPHMVFFTTPELLEVGSLPFISPYEKPTRVEALKYYRRVADTFDLRIAFDERILSVTPEPDEAASLGERSLFSVVTTSSKGVERTRYARHVVMAIGYYDRPNRLNVPGEDLAHVQHYYAEPYACYRQRVVIVGGGNSAAEAALELHRAGASVTIVHRGSALKSTIKYWVRPDIDNRIREGSIAARFGCRVAEIKSTSVVIAGAHEEELAADSVFLLVGYRTDAELLRRAGITLNEREAPTYDTETFETNVPGLFVAGGAVAGVDTGTVFIENGRFHGERIVDAIANRLRG